MTEDAVTKVNRMRQRIYHSDIIREADKCVLFEFDSEIALRGSTYGEHRHENLLRHVVLMAEEVGGLADCLEDRTATQRLVSWIHRNYSNEETNRDYRGALRSFSKLVSDGTGLPDSVDWVSGSTSKDYNPIPDPSEMLHWDDHIEPMLDAADYLRDRAMIAVAWDAGCRSGEFRNLTVGDVSEHDHGLRITVDGKTGQRAVTLIPSVPYLERWLEAHPGDDPDDPLWSHLNKPDDLSYQAYRQILEGTAEDAGVDRPVTLTNFRKSSASYLAPRVSQATLEAHHGWQHGSRAAARYIAVFDEDSDREIASAHGVEVDSETESESATQTCPVCDTLNELGRQRCRQCRQVLDRELAQVETALEEFGDAVDAKLIELADREARKELVAAEQVLESRRDNLTVEDVHTALSSLDSDRA
jgi:integrase